MPRSASVGGLAKRGVIPRKQFYIKLFFFNTVILACFGIPTVGAGATGGGLFTLGQPVVGSKPFVTPGSSIGTSPISSGLRNVIPGRMPFQLPTPVGGLGTGRPLSFTWTNSPGALLGRWAPFVGVASVIYGVVQLNDCLSSTPTQ